MAEQNGNAVVFQNLSCLTKVGNEIISIIFGSPSCMNRSHFVGVFASPGCLECPHKKFLSK